MAPQPILESPVVSALIPPVGSGGPDEERQNAHDDRRGNRRADPDRGTHTPIMRLDGWLAMRPHGLPPPWKQPAVIGSGRRASHAFATCIPKVQALKQLRYEFLLEPEAEAPRRAGGAAEEADALRPILLLLVVLDGL